MDDCSRSYLGIGVANQAAVSAFMAIQRLIVFVTVMRPVNDS
jgi:hypothetical protein